MDQAREMEEKRRSAIPGLVKPDMATNGSSK